ncbi:hypothetical protein [Pontibacter harenae]|uniref:hypothetical protein n=1 Tax=Pontibacter harenae TaxID=2894083 RepID=UPI001E34F804|nr:hypothetical protein [Pontibacter harenae]MCC9169133.1 hypothetical protein [Pontibacter harenae]
MNKSEKRRKQSGDGDDKNKLEWTVFAISLGLVLSILGFLGYKIYKDQATPPDLYVEHVHDPSKLSPYRYRVVVHNVGGETAGEVTVELVLKKGEIVLEQAELAIAFVPKNSKREGWVNFVDNPALADTIVNRVISYKRP